MSLDLFDAVEQVNERQKRCCSRRRAAWLGGRPGKHDRRLGSRLQGGNRRHAREPRHGPDRGRCSRPGRRCGRMIPKAVESPRRFSASASPMPSDPYSALRRCGRPRHRDRMAGVPHTRLRAHRGLCAGRSSSTAATSTSRSGCASWASGTTASGAAAGMTRVLVTGAAGFLGSHLAEALLARGDEVTGVDNFDPFYARSVKLDNLGACQGQRRFRLVEADVRDEAQLARFSRPRPSSSTWRRWPVCGRHSRPRSATRTSMSAVRPRC